MTFTGLFALSVLMVLSASCGESPAPAGSEATGEPGAHEDTADVRPELMRAEPEEIAPGERVALHFPEEPVRGAGYTLEELVDRGWHVRYYLTAIADGYNLDEPRWEPATRPPSWDDIDISGPGPDVVVVPEGAARGTYRLCAAGKGICAMLHVTADDRSG